MSKVIYKPVPKYAMPDSTVQFGIAFDKGKAVEVTDEKKLAKFRGHPFFDVAEDKKN